MKPLSIDKTLRVRLHNADCLTSTENNTLTRYVVLNSIAGCSFPVIQICTGRCPLSAAPPSSHWMQWMYLDSALNYCSARTTINNYLVRWCLLLFHFSLEANVRANLVPEILRTCIKHWSPAQIPALCWFITMFCSVHFGSCISPHHHLFKLHFFTPYSKVILLWLTAIIFSCLETNRNNSAKRAKHCFGGNFAACWWPQCTENTVSCFGWSFLLDPA